MTITDTKRVAVMAAVIIGLHLAGWFTLAVLVAPNHFGAAGTSYGVGVGVTAYTLGMRHAFDADHIAAIDNTTRRLTDRERRPVSVGFWFSLGHSSIVFGLTLLLSLGVRRVAGQVADEHSTLHAITGWAGTTISSLFLYAIAFVNVVALVGLWRVLRTGEGELERHLDRRGLLTRLLGRTTRSITEPWHMYLIGLLFGLGFDTASEVALLVLAASGAASALPWYAILCLPVLFAAGMCLLDTIDGWFMSFAYQWAFTRPARKAYYNLTVTALSAAVAILIGTVELLDLVAEKTHRSTAFWTKIDLDTMGYVVVALLAVTWLVAVLVRNRGPRRKQTSWNAS
jgi:high-affinity nickel-transport protein